MADQKISFRDEVAQEIVHRIEEGTAPWQKPWDAGATGVAPFNPTSGKAYRGINDLWLSLKGHADPRWMTYRQAEAAGAQVRKGERATGIEYWQWSVSEPLKDDNGNPVLDADGKQTYRTARLDRPRVFYAKVFNAEQIDGLAPWIVPAPSFDPLERAEAIVAGAGVPVLHDQHDRAFYRPMTDEIHLPPLAAFKGRAEYYETALHELGHATGHGSRLDRFFGPFGSEGYAREELRAEIASYMLARDMGISFDPSNHAAYVEGWLKALREDKNEIFHAARDAETIKTWVMEPERRQALVEAAQQKAAGKERAEAASLAPQAAPPVLTADAYAGKIDAALASLPNAWQARIALYDAYRAYAGGEARDLRDSLGIPDRSSQRFGAVFHEDGISEKDVDTLIQRASIAATWPARAAELLGISDSAPEITELSQTLPYADWRYDYSDDASVREREHKRITHIYALAESLLRRSATHADLVSAIWDSLCPTTEDQGRVYQPGIKFYIPDAERLSDLTRQLAVDPVAATYQALGMPAEFVRAAQTPAPALSETAGQSREGPGRAASQGEEPAMSGPSRIRSYIAVPFAEKDEAKGLGAKWDRKEKSWYVPEGVDQAAFAKWSGKAPEPAPAVSPVDEFADFLKTNGLTVTGVPVMDGKWHRVAVEGDKGKSLSGSYRGFLDGRPSGQVTNFKAGINAAKWVATGIALTDAERARIQAEAAEVRARREAERLESAQKAAKVAFGVWQNLPAAATPENCPYLKAKGVQGHGVKVDAEGHLVVPARDAGGRLWGVQVFHEDGKRFIKDAHKVGTMHVIAHAGNKLADIAAHPGPIVIGEGYATLSTIYEATKYPTVIAFDSGNLKPVAEAVRATYPDREMVIAADNDHANVNGNVGVRKAEEAAQAVKAVVAVPPLDAGEKAQGLTDFNDLGESRNKLWVKSAIDEVLGQTRRQSADLGRGVA